MEETQPKKKERLPKYTPEDADEFATIAIAQLERISDNDKQKDDALLRVIKYCNSRIN